MCVVRKRDAELTGSKSNSTWKYMSRVSMATKKNKKNIVFENYKFL